MKLHKLPALFGATALAVGLTATATAQSGDIEVAGSSTVYPIANFVGEQFKNIEGIEVKVQSIGTGGGFGAFAKGDTDASNASRPIKAKEFKACVENGIEFIETAVAYDGLTIIINKQNDWATELTTEHLRAIFSADSDAETWNDIDPSFPDIALAIFRPAATSGTFDYFKEVVIGKTGDLRGEPMGEKDALTIRSVQGNPGGIGFLGSSYYFENKDTLTSVKIKNAAGNFVGPTPDSIESGDYNPFSRPLFVYWNVASLNKPEVASFVEFFLDIAPEAAAKEGYVALPQWAYDAAIDRVNSRITGSIYYDADFNRKEGSFKELMGH